MTTSDHRHHHEAHQKPDDTETRDVEIDSGRRSTVALCPHRCASAPLELVELETALNDIEKAMDKIESQNSNIQSKLRDLLESNRQMAKEFTDIRRGMANKFQDVARDLEQTSGTAHDLAAVTTSTLNKIEHEMATSHEHHPSK